MKDDIESNLIKLTVIEGLFIKVPSLHHPRTTAAYIVVTFAPFQGGVVYPLKNQKGITGCEDCSQNHLLNKNLFIKNSYLT